MCHERCCNYPCAALLALSHSACCLRQPLRVVSAVMHAHRRIILVQAARVDALGALAALLQTLEGSRAAAGRLATVWPPLLALLWDRAADVRAAAAPVVGRLGAIAARKNDGTYTGTLPRCASTGSISLLRVPWPCRSPLWPDQEQNTSEPLPCCKASP